MGENALKYSRLIIVVMAVMFLVGARVDAALSLEARSAIEEMRARVNNTTTETRPSVDDNGGVYVPGSELYMVLAKYRTQIYGAPDATEESLVNWRVSVAEPGQIDPSSYQPGSMLEKALVNYRTQRNVFNLVKIMKAKEIAGRADSESSATAGSHDTNEPAKSSHETVMQPVTVNSSELLSQSRSALNANSDQDASPALKISNDKSAVSADSTDSSIEPAANSDRSEAAVQKYEFKMPSNYRIKVD